MSSSLPDFPVNVVVPSDSLVPAYVTFCVLLMSALYCLYRSPAQSETPIDSISQTQDSLEEKDEFQDKLNELLHDASTIPLPKQRQSLSRTFSANPPPRNRRRRSPSPPYPKKKLPTRTKTKETAPRNHPSSKESPLTAVNRFWKEIRENMPPPSPKLPPLRNRGSKTKTHPFFQAPEFIIPSSSEEKDLEGIAFTTPTKKKPKKRKNEEDFLDLPSTFQQNWTERKKEQSGLHQKLLTEKHAASSSSLSSSPLRRSGLHAPQDTASKKKCLRVKKIYKETVKAIKTASASEELKETIKEQNERLAALLEEYTAREKAEEKQRQEEERKRQAQAHAQQAAARQAAANQAAQNLGYGTE